MILSTMSRSVDVSQYEDDNITNYNDDTTLCPCTQDISSIISELQGVAKKFRLM